MSRVLGSSSDWTLIWTLMDSVSRVSCVSWMYWVYAAETHETFHTESGMRYQLSTTTYCGSLPPATLHLVVCTESCVGERLCGTTPDRRFARALDLRDGSKPVSKRLTAAGLHPRVVLRSSRPGPSESHAGVTTNRRPRGRVERWR
jgi:hypothetical protein